MTVSTKDCKEFIESISQAIDASAQDKWKRIRKYKENDLVLRDFENQDGRTLTICEKNGKLSLYQLNLSSITTAIKEGWGIKYLGHKAKPQDISNFLSDCIKAEPEIVYEDAIEPAKNPKSWEQDCKIDCSQDDDEDDEEIDLDLYYVDENHNTVTLNKEDVAFIHVFFMPDFDTTYRISVFETKDHYLYLGNNDPD